MSHQDHAYAVGLAWTGNTGHGTSTYAGYSREYRVELAGKPVFIGSADPAFRGDAALPNPEDLFVTAIASCHMLSYLALCARRGLNVVNYEDNATGVMRLDGRGGGRFEEVVLRPVVTVAAGGDLDLARQLHHDAHELCYIASSCSVPIRHEPVIRTKA